MTCHDASLHLCTIQGTNVAVQCQLSKVCGARGEKNSQSHVLRQLISSAFPMALFQEFPRLGWYVRGRLFWRLPVERGFACCRPDSSQLLTGHTEQPVSAIVPILVLVQLLGQLPEHPLRSLRSRNMLQLLIHLVRHTEFMLKMRHRDRLLLVLCSSSSPVSALRALR